MTPSEIISQRRSQGLETLTRNPWSQEIKTRQRQHPADPDLPLLISRNAEEQKRQQQALGISPSSYTRREQLIARTWSLYDKILTSPAISPLSINEIADQALKLEEIESQAIRLKVRTPDLFRTRLTSLVDRYLTLLQTLPSPHNNLSPDNPPSKNLSLDNPSQKPLPDLTKPLLNCWSRNPIPRYLPS